MTDRTIRSTLPTRAGGRLLRFALAACVVMVAIVHGDGSVHGAPEAVGRMATDWTIPDEETVSRWIAEWIGRVGMDRASAARVNASWQASRRPPADVPDASIDPVEASLRSREHGSLLDRVIAAIAESDERVRMLLPSLSTAIKPAKPDRGEAPVGPTGDLSWVEGEDVDPFVRDAVRLQAARLLVEEGLYEEALRVLDGTDDHPAARADLSRSVDPARQLFLQAACLHWLLQADRATDALERLLERSDEIPVRYERMARLMLEDLSSLENDSLDHIARRMRDVTRRLSFGRAGARTREVQDGVIESLDKLIAKLEQQQQDQNAQGGGAGGGAGGGSGSRPMQDSMPAGGTGPGEVTKRDLGEPADWGNLPPREREAALQQIGREFPPHYREAIEQYFKRLAAGRERTDVPGAQSRPATPP